MPSDKSEWEFSLHFTSSSNIVVPSLYLRFEPISVWNKDPKNEAVLNLWHLSIKGLDHEILLNKVILSYLALKETKAI